MSKSDENRRRLNRRQALLMLAAGMGAALAAEAAHSTLRPVSVL
jgi:hypothetical protein